MSEQHTPFKTLGEHLKYLRQQSNESLAEVSGAVEIDEPVLERIEGGHERPAEDILLLLITHFNMHDQEAVQLWGLAGYDGAPETANPIHGASDDDTVQAAQKAVIMFLAHDTRTMYSDTFDVNCGTGGVTLHFSQQSGPTKQPLTISQVGMSYEQAEKVLAQLQFSLLKAKYGHGPKQLPPPRSSSDSANA